MRSRKLEPTRRRRTVRMSRRKLSSRRRRRSRWRERVRERRMSFGARRGQRRRRTRHRHRHRQLLPILTGATRRRERIIKISRWRRWERIRRMRVGNRRVLLHCCCFRCRRRGWRRMRETRARSHRHARKTRRWRPSEKAWRRMLQYRLGRQTRCNGEHLDERCRSWLCLGIAWHAWRLRRRACQGNTNNSSAGNDDDKEANVPASVTDHTMLPNLNVFFTLTKDKSAPQHKPDARKTHPADHNTSIAPSSSITRNKLTSYTPVAARTRMRPPGTSSARRSSSDFFLRSFLAISLCAVQNTST